MTVKMMKVVAAASVVVCLGTASAQQMISVNFGQQGASEAPQTGGDTVKVQGRGVGANRDEALKDAYRDAIERAVGLYVDAETVANNDQIVTDQVLTHSNAYITDYRELGMKQLNGGLVQLRILATVKKQALTTKLTDVMPAQTVRIDNTGLQNVHAQLVTKEKRAEDAAALLKNALEGLNPMKSLMVASIRPETQKILTGEAAKINYKPLPANQVMLRYLFEVKLDREKYFSEFMPHLKKVLDQISIAKPKEIRLTELMCHSENGFASRADNVKHFIDGNEIKRDERSGREVRPVFDWRWGDNDGVLYNPIHAYSILWQGDSLMLSESRQSFDYGYGFEFFREHFRPGNSVDRNSWRPNRAQMQYGNSFSYPERMKKFGFALITCLNVDCSNGKVTIYELEKPMFDILSEWRRSLVGRVSIPTDSDGKKTSYNIILLDKNGEEIGVYPWQIPNGVLINVKFAEICDKNGSTVYESMVYATPFIGCFGESMLQWRDFILEKDQLTKVASIKIEPAD